MPKKNLDKIFEKDLFPLRHYVDKISGVLSCYDRIVLKGSLPTVCHAQGMSNHLFKNNILIFDYTKYVEPLRDKLRANAEQLAATNNLKIEFIRSSKARKEDIVKKHFDGKKTGLVYLSEIIITFTHVEDIVCKTKFHKKRDSIIVNIFPLFKNYLGRYW